MSRVHVAKRRRLSPPEYEVSNGIASSFAKNASAWNLEQDYENRPRNLNKKNKESTRLPIKTAEGWVEAAAEPQEAAEEDEDEDSFLGSGSEGEEDEEGSDDDEDGTEDPKPKVSQRQLILEAKEDLARLAGLINEDPEEHTGVLRHLAKHAESKNVTIKKLALATQLAVYKDIIPGYRIRPASETEMKEKLSKEVRKLRDYEQAIVHGYQDYVKDLARCSKGSSPGSSVEMASLATVAIGCACNLLLAVPHFNFRGDVLKILVDKLSTKSLDADFSKCRETLEKLFEEDEDGNASLDAVTMVTKMLKGKHYNVHESVLNTFLHLRLLSEFSQKASYDKVDKAGDQPFGKKPKQKREFRTKKQRKQMKERKEVEKEFKEADATVSHEERDRMQAETLKLVFVTYFRILKERSPSLMGAVLEGLARYAHLINQDFFGDILEALKDLIAEAETSEELEDEDAEEDESTGSRNATRESLLCVITAFALLQGQDASKAASSLHLDLNYFITHLYRTLYPVSMNPDIELSSNSLHLPDPNAPGSHHTSATNKVNVQTTTVLLLRSLASVLLPQTAVRAVPPLRVAAFTKQLLTASLQLPEKSCLAMISLLSKVTKVHTRKIAGMWNTEERKGDGVFDALRADIEGSNPFASTVWEGEILRRHFCPQVREAVKGMEKNLLDT